MKLAGVAVAILISVQALIAVFENKWIWVFILLWISPDKFGQRAFVGKVCMDMNDSVPQYKETTEDSVQETERWGD